MLVAQAASAADFLGHRPHWLVKLGSGYLPGSGMGHLLLLHLEGSQIYRKGESSCAFVSSLHLITGCHVVIVSLSACSHVAPSNATAQKNMVAVPCRWSTSLPPSHLLCYWSCWSEGSPYQGPPGGSTSTCTPTWTDCQTHRYFPIAQTVPALLWDALPNAIIKPCFTVKREEIARGAKLQNLVEKCCPDSNKI